MEEFLKGYFDDFLPPCVVVESQEIVLKHRLVIVGLIKGVDGNMHNAEAIIVMPEGIFVFPLIHVKGNQKLLPDIDSCRKTESFDERFSEIKVFLENFKKRFKGREDELTKKSPYSQSLLHAMSGGLIIPPDIPTVDHLIATADKP